MFCRAATPEIAQGEKISLEYLNFVFVNTEDRCRWQRHLLFPAGVFVKDLILFAVYLCPFLTRKVMAKDLACRNLVGNQMILNRDKASRRRLGIARKEKIFATLGVGLPAVPFRNKVAGKRLPLTWIRASREGRPNAGF
jgi:hypothetical protein